MRIVIYGAGGIGCVIGGHLWRTGTDVILIGRPGHVEAIKESGLSLITPSGTFNLPIPAVTDPGQIAYAPDDVVLLCMKAHDTEAALRSLQAVVRDVPVFCIQNGVRNEETAAAYFPSVYGAMVRIGAEYLSDGEIKARRDPPGWLYMGCYPSGTDELLKKVAQKLQTAGFLVTVTPDVMPYKWGKLMGNLANAVDAITNANMAEMGFIAEAARRELADLLRDTGIRWIADDLPDKKPETNFIPRPDAQMRSSTWQSLTRRQGSVETEFLNGEVVRLARQLGRNAPINEGLLRISQEMAANREKPGKYTPRQLGELLGIENR